MAHHSNNPCLCDSVPAWAANVTLPNAANTSLGMSCINAPLWCAPDLPAAWYADNAPLLALKAAAVGNSSQDALATWNVWRPACTSVNSTGTCAPCTWRDPVCGVVRAGDGVRLCNARFVSCRERRVVGIHLSHTVGDGGGSKG